MLTEKQEYIVEKLNEIGDMAGELMNMAVTGEDGNLEEMSYHIRVYSKKIVAHLLKNWNLNERVAKRRAEKARIAALEAEQNPEPKVSDISFIRKK